jgi:hypothetical protein
MVERREHSCFPLEAGEAFRIVGHLLEQELDCDLAAEPRVTGAMDLAHPSRAESREP